MTQQATGQIPTRPTAAPPAGSLPNSPPWEASAPPSPSSPTSRAGATVTPTRHARIDILEKRIAALEAHAASISKPIPFWRTASANLPGALVSSAVAVVGFFLVHRFSVMRQERDEFYKRVQDCVEVVNTAARTASGLWRQTGKVANGKGDVENLQDAITDIAQRLAFLKTLEAKYDVEIVFAEFKRTATLNIEDTTRPADPQRADESRRTGRYLTGAMQTAFYNTFPATKKRGPRPKFWWRGKQTSK